MCFLVCTDGNCRLWLRAVDRSANVLQYVVDHALLWLALVLVEIGLKLEFGFFRVDQKLLPGTESQPAYVAKCQARSAANESNDFHIAIGHRNIIARHQG
jgi:hypothetical protein